MRLSILLLPIAASLALWGCSRDTGVSSGLNTTTQSGVLRIAIEQDVKTLNPTLSSTTVDNFVQRLMFEPLISADAHGTPVPILAAGVPSLANGGISRDGLTVVYHLRRSPHWSDGVAVTSADVKFSWSAIMNPNNNAVSRHGYDDVAAIDTPDPYTVVVHLKHPFAPFVNTFFAESDQPYTIVPAHVLAKYPNINQVAFNTDPSVSDGPFLFDGWTHGDHISLKQNPNFFLGTPHLRSVEIRVVPDENTSVSMLRTGEIDFMYQPSIVTYPTIRDIPGVHVVWDQMNGWAGVQVNMSHPPLNDPRVRDAIALAIDKTKIVQTVTYGKERVATGDIPDWIWAARGLPPYGGADVTKAKSILQQAGVRKLSLLLIADAANATHHRVAVELQSMLQGAGIETEIKYYPADLMYAPAGMGGIMHGGRFDLAVETWYAGTDPDNASQFMCAMMPPNGYNDARYCNREMDALQHEALATNDLALRRDAYRKIEALVVRDHPIIPFWWMVQAEAISDRFSGFSPNPVCESWNSWQWSI